MGERQININLDFKTSPEFACSLTTNVINFLLHYRQIIPFNFEMFEKFIKKIKLEEVSCFKRLKSINSAKETYERICEVKELLMHEFTSSRSMCMVFGKSIFTAIEAYEIQFPPLPNENSSPTFINETATLRRVLLQLVQNDILLQHCQQLPATNVFFLFNRSIPIESDDLIELRDYKLNKSCKKFSIKFVDATTSFEVFQDNFDDMLTIKDESDDEIEKTDLFTEIIEPNWYQSKVFVKSFNDMLVNNKSIWD